MLLALNVGNTDIALCIWEGNEILFSAELSTDTTRTADEYAAQLFQIFSMREFDYRKITDVIIASVVPTLDETIRAAVAQFTAARPVFIGAGIKTGMKIRIDTPSQLGADLVSLASGAKRYTQGACIIALFDTATTLTVLDLEGDVVGAVIMPGVLSSARALKRDAALLLECSLSKPRCVIGKNTTDSLRSGLIIGAAAQIDGMILRIAGELGCTVSDITLLATGKYAQQVTPHCSYTFRTVPHLLFEGLHTLFCRNHP
ncbi:MAG: type III pantothenate kinase [Clostridia bacterium]|nr:type III pantothenate kinase [Clostridia bacterium]